MGIINKKSFKILVIFFSFIMSLVFSTKVYAADIKATDITLIDKSSTAEVDTPVMVNNEITSKITLNKENDYAVFDLTIKNNEKNKYKIESIIDNNENNYINVSYDYSKDYFQEETKVKIKFLYKNKLINQEKVSMDNLVITIKLVNDKGESTNIIINNPKTGDSISLYIIIFILGILGLIYTKKKIDFKGIKVGISVLIFAILLLPFVIFALDRYEIPITFKRVEAKGEFEVYDVMVEGIGIRQVTYGNEIGELPEQPRDGYSFNGYENQNGVAVSSDTIVTGPMTVRPMYTAITYNITYDYNGGYAVNPDTYTVENTITLNNPTKKGYTFAGWTGSNGDTLQTEVTISSLTGNLNYVANYSANPDTAYKVIHRYPNLDGTYTEEVENLTGATDSSVRPQTKDKTGFTSPALQDIVINADGTSVLIYTYTRNNYNLTLTNPEDIESVFTTGSYPYETLITVKAKDKQGYTFTKWSDNETAKEYTFELVKDTELYPIYTPNTDTAYTVLHKKQNFDETYTLEETENLTGTTDTEVTPGVKTYTGFTSPQEQTVRIKPDGTLVVEYLYTRNRYTLNIEDKDKIEEDKSGEYYYGTEITVVAKDIPGYVFTGWENGGNTKVYTFTLTGDKTIKPLYTPGESTPYTVIHKKMNIDGTTYTVAETENLTGVTDTNVTPNTKTYTGFTSPSTQTVKIKGDGTTVVEYLYTRNQYSLVYVNNDNIDLPNSTTPGDYYYGTEITIKAKEIPGYTFKQWSTGETDNPLTVILEDNLVINPEYTPNKYNVIFNSNTGTGTMDNEEMTYDVEKALSKNLFTKPGYVFKGWNKKADKTGTHYDDEESVKNLATSGNITLYAEWIEAQSTFLPGKNVNEKMKVLAGNSSASYTSNDNNITSIQKSSIKPNLSTMTNKNIVSTSNSTAPIYMWYDNGTIYWWSEDTTPSLNDDCSYMFSSLKSVTNIELDTFNTSNVTNMERMFKGNEILTTIDVSHFDTSNVTNMSGMFASCSGLTTLDVSHFNTSNVTTMDNMFMWCESLPELDVSHFDTSNVTDMAAMFHWCKNLTTLDVSNFDTSNVTSMSAMFQNCNSLTNLDVSNFNTSNVTKMKNMFSNCNGLTSLDVSSFDTSNVTDMSYMFYQSENLKTIYASNKFVTNNVTSSNYMFSGDTKIEGGMGTRYSASHIDKEYAHLDGGVSNPGYFVNKGTVNISFDANGGSFSDSSTTRPITYSYDTDVTLYSHTSNIDNSGTQNGNYSNGLATKDVISLPGASSLHLTITYGTENNYDMLYVFEGEYTGDVTRNMSAGQLQKYMGSNTSPTTVELDVTGDTVTFAFYSDSSTNYYGYYAVVTGTGLGGTPEYEIPTKPGYIFEGWYTDTALTNRFELNSSNIPTDLSSNRTVYAKYREATATFDTGSRVNAKMKHLAGNSSATSSSADTTITSFQKSTTIPNEYKTSDYIVSSSDSDVPIYMWFDNGTIYWYTDAPGTVYLNSNSSSLFQELRGITSIELDKFDTSNVTNMSRMFDYCLDLQNLDVSHFDTSNVTDMSFMFNYTNLISLDLSNLDTSKVTSMENMFYGCDELTNLNVSSFNTSNVTNMSRMFQQCKKLPTLDVTNFDTSNVTNMKGMFYECNNLTALDVSNFVTNKVTDMSDMFYDCNHLTTLDVTNFATNKVTDMSYMFGKCINLTSLDVSHFNTSKVTNMEDMFYDCEKITSLDVTHFDTSKVTNMKAMFRDCYNLTTLDVSHFDTANVTTMEWMFRGCTSLPSLDVTHFDTSNVTNMRSMFEDCTNLASLDVTHFVTDNVTTMGWMFRGCTSLPSLDVTHFNTSNVTDMSNMFCLCSSLTSLDVTHFNTSNVKAMDSMFNQCTNLVTVDVSGFDTSNVTDMGRMFLDCKSLESIDVTHFDTSKVKYMNYMFDGCSKLISLDVTHFNTNNVEYMNSMFEGCTGLTTLDLSSFNTSNVHAINEMFLKDTSLTTIYVSNNFDTTNASSSWAMFTSCYNLTGGSGTTLDTNYLDKTYARIDDPDNGNPGYFTYKAAPTGAGGNISKVINMIKNNGNKIVLLGSAILVIILGIVIKLVNRKKKSS